MAYLDRSVKYQTKAQFQSPQESLPVTILLVDDRPSQLSLYENALRDLNEPLVKATSVHEALNHLRMFEVAIVLINTSRPGIDAIELAAAMRRQPLLQEIPIIFLSDTQESAVDQMLGYGAVLLIIFPRQSRYFMPE